MKKFKNMMLAAIALGVGFTFAGVGSASAEGVSIGGKAVSFLNVTDSKGGVSHPMNGGVDAEIELSGSTEKEGMTGSFTAVFDLGAAEAGDVNVTLDTGTVAVTMGTQGGSEVCAPIVKVKGGYKDNCIAAGANPFLTASFAGLPVDLTVGIVAGNDQDTQSKTSGFDLSLGAEAGPASIGLGFNSYTSGQGYADNDSAGTSNSVTGVSVNMPIGSIEVGAAFGSGTAGDKTTAHTKIGASFDLGAMGKAGISIGTATVNAGTTGATDVVTTQTHLGYVKKIAGVSVSFETSSKAVTDKDADSKTLIAMKYGF